LVIRGSIQLSGKQFSCNSHGSGIAWQIKLQRIIHSNQSKFWQWIRSLCQSNSGSGFVYLAKSAAVVVANESARLHQTQRHQHLTWEGQSRLSKLPSVVQVDASHSVCRPFMAADNALQNEISCSSHGSEIAWRISLQRIIQYKQFRVPAVHSCQHTLLNQNQLQQPWQ